MNTTSSVCLQITPSARRHPAKLCMLQVPPLHPPSACWFSRANKVTQEWIGTVLSDCSVLLPAQNRKSKTVYLGRLGPMELHTITAAKMSANFYKLVGSLGPRHRRHPNPDTRIYRKDRLDPYASYNALPRLGCPRDTAPFA
jgi:hypothetical protein